MPASLSELPQENTYLVARTLADGILERLDGWLPGWHEWDGLDFRFAFRFHVQMFLANHSLHFLLAAVSEAGHRPLIVIDGHLDAHLLSRWLTNQGLPVTMPMHFRTSLTRSRLQRKLAQWRSLPDAPHPEAHVTGGVLALLPHAVHQDILAPVLETLSSQGPVYRLNTQVRGGAQPDGLPPLRRNAFMEGALAHLEALSKRLSLLSPDAQTFCLNQLDLLIDLLEKYAVFSDVMQAFRPHTVVGCLEYNSYGAFSSLHKARQPFRLVDVQHGIVTPTGSMDGFDFDTYLLWNQRTADVVLEDGYRHPQSLHVVGNAKWEALEQEIRQPPTPTVASLLSWKAESPLIGAYTQCLQGYSTKALKRRYLEVLLQYLAQRPQCKLLIKKHPLETDTTVEKMVQNSGFADRIRVLTSAQCTLAESLQAVDGVTSVFSSTLMEALYLRKPALAVDFENVLEQQGVPLTDALPVVRRPEEFAASLDRLLQADSLNGGDAPSLQALVPRFDRPYAERIRDILRDPSLV